MIDFDINKVMQYLPHRYPFLMVDRVQECTPGESLVGLKNVSINEPYFQGHFPALPVMPGVLILEALAQTTGLLAFCSMGLEPGEHNKLYLFVGIDKARFRDQVTPGDQLILKAQLKRQMKGVWMFDTEAWVGDKLVAEAAIMCSAQDFEQ